MAIGNAPKNARKMSRIGGITKTVKTWTFRRIIKNTFGILKRDERAAFFYIQFFYEPNIWLKAMQLEGETSDFRDIYEFQSRLSQERKNMKIWIWLIPLESPCDSAHNSPSLDFQSHFPDYDPINKSGKRRYFGPVQWEITCY